MEPRSPRPEGSPALPAGSGTSGGTSPLWGRGPGLMPPPGVVLWEKRLSDPPEAPVVPRGQRGVPGRALAASPAAAAARHEHSDPKRVLCSRSSRARTELPVHSGSYPHLPAQKPPAPSPDGGVLKTPKKRQ